MTSRPLPFPLDPSDALRNPLDWSQISRHEAIRAVDNGFIVVVTTGGDGSASRFDDHSPVFPSTGPYNYSALRYFVFRAKEAYGRISGSIEHRSRAKKIALIVPEGADGDQLEPLETEVSHGEEKGSLYNLVWIQDRKGEEQEITASELGASVKVRVESQGLMPGESLQFQLVREADGKKIAVLSGRIAENRIDNCAVAAWILEERDTEAKLVVGDRIVPYCRFNKQGLECKGTPLEIADRSHLGGVKIQFTDALGNPLMPKHGLLKRDGYLVWEGPFNNYELELTNLEYGLLIAELELEERKFQVTIPWQGHPLVTQKYPLKFLSEGI